MHTRDLVRESLCAQIFECKNVQRCICFMHNIKYFVKIKHYSASIWQTFQSKTIVESLPFKVPQEITVAEDIGYCRRSQYKVIKYLSFLFHNVLPY